LLELERFNCGLECNKLFNAILSKLPEDYTTVLRCSGESCLVCKVPLNSSDTVRMLIKVLAVDVIRVWENLLSIILVSFSYLEDWPLMRSFGLILSEIVNME
jgi:hypothetical protein